jgi:hypothetical protein
MQLRHPKMSSWQSSVAIAPGGTYPGENQTSCFRVSKDTLSQSSAMLTTEVIYTAWYEFHLMLQGIT